VVFTSGACLFPPSGRRVNNAVLAQMPGGLSVLSFSCQLALCPAFFASSLCWVYRSFSPEEMRFLGAFFTRPPGFFLLPPNVRTVILPLDDAPRSFFYWLLAPRWISGVVGYSRAGRQIFFHFPCSIWKGNFSYRLPFPPPPFFLIASVPLLR